MTLWLLLVFSILSVNGHKCPDDYSVDLTGGKELSGGGTIVKDGITYPSKYTYTGSISGTIKLYGCVCELRKCIRKCCDLNKVEFNKTCVDRPELNIIRNEGLKLHYIDSYRRKFNGDSSDKNGFVYGKPCSGRVYLETMRKWYMQEVSLDLSIAFYCSKESH